MTDKTTVSPFSSVTISDVDLPAQTQTVSVTLDAATQGSFTTLNGFTNAGGGVYTLSGTASAATTAIHGLVFTPTANRITPGTTETTTFTISTNDGVASAVTDNTTTVVSTSVNDAPTVAHTIPDQNTTALTAFTFAFAGNTFANVDIGDSLNYSATKSDGTALPGWLTFTAATRTLSGTPSHSDVGTLAIKVTATDGSSVSDTFDLVIAEGTHLPGLSINDVTVTEGTVSAMFRVTLSVASPLPVTVTYETANGTATAGSDFTTASKTLTFSPGETSKTVTVLVKGDSVDESNETFFVNLSSPINASIDDAQGQGMILDNDAAPKLSINDVTVTEGTGGTVEAVFTVTLSAASNLPVSVNYSTANDTAVARDDYTALLNRTLSFAAGVTTKTITVAIAGDARDELDETFFVNLNLPKGGTNATITDGQGLGTIIDNDPTPALSINDVTVTERKGRVVNAFFKVTLSAASSLPVSVTYATANNSALDFVDYTPASGMLTFAPGETTKTILVPIIGDSESESSESLFLNLTNARNALFADDQGLATVLDSVQH